MKPKLVLFFLIFGIATLNAQTYYKIIFSGEPDSILVENLTKGTSLTLQGTDTLTLKLSGVGVQETDRSKRTLIIYPNPMDHSCRFDFENTTQGKVEILLFNANGKKLHDFNARLSAGMHQFELSGVPAGFYHLQIKTESYRMSGSFVSTYESAPDIALIHIKESPFRQTNGNSDGGQKLSQEDVPLSFRSIVVMDFSTGDQLIFTGYKTNSDDDIEFASPTGDQTIAFTFCVRPGQPSAITGNDNPCVSTTQNYAVTNVVGVTYTWTVPIDWTIVSGQGSSQISVTIGSTSGNITALPSNNCGSGTARTFAVTTYNFPVQPSAIIGTENPCQNSSETYSVTNVPGTTYTWTVPTDWTITNGQGTNSITVTVGVTTGNILVTPSNNCGSGASRTLAVTTQTGGAGQPSPITGDENPCEGTQGLVYSVFHVDGVNYIWEVPAGWEITSGQGTNSITVTAGAASGNIIVTPSNDCGNGVARSLAVIAQSVPEQPSEIEGPGNPCVVTEVSYSVTAESGVTYFWTVPAGWIIDYGQNTNEIFIVTSTTSGIISVTPSNECGIGLARTLAVTIQYPPDQPSAISGNADVCQGETGLTYAVANVPGVTYHWIIPNDWTFTSGQGTNSILVKAGALSGQIQVIPENECGAGSFSTLMVTSLQIPAQPSAISGNNNPCVGESGLIYSVTDVPGESYFWTVPNGWTITNGQNTSIITVTIGNAWGEISVTPSNDCGFGISRTLSVTTHSVPDDQDEIDGNENPCQEVSGLIYSVFNIPGVDYWWTVPTGWTITAGQNTNIITVTSGILSGNISVTPSNDCGNITPQTLMVTTQSVPDQPSVINGNINPCQDETGIEYSVTNVPGVEYFWSVPSGWSIASGQNTNSITVTAGTTSGTISVLPSNDCGNGITRTLSVTAQTVPATPTAGIHVPSQTQIVWNWNTVAGALGYKFNTANNFATATDNGTSTTSTQTGLNCNTAYTLYVWAYNGCGNSSSQQLSQTTSACAPSCGSPVTFIYNGNTVTYGSVTSANNRCWLDRNLGAEQVATSSADGASYGDLFQWGRLDDGHQERTSPTTATLSNSDVPGHGNFITVQNYPYDWRSPQNNNLWQGVYGANNPCPDTYRLPTQAEWDAERMSWSSNNAAGAFASPLKLSMAGLRNYLAGAILGVGSSAYYWSSTIISNNAWSLNLSTVNAYMNEGNRAHGVSVRCIKD